MKQLEKISKFDYKFIKCKSKPKGTILFIPGFAMTYDYHIVDKQLANNYDYYALNLPGNEKDITRSKYWLKPFNIAKFVVQFIDFMNLKNIYLIGHSFGGMIASFVVVLAKNKIKKVILGSPANLSNVYSIFKVLSGIMYPKTWKQKYKELSVLIGDISKFNNDKQWFKRHKKELDHQLKHWKELKYTGRKMSNLPIISKTNKYMKIIDKPTCVFLGKKDGLMKYKPSFRILSKTNKKFKFVSFENSGHLYIEEEPELYVKHINEFFND